MSAETLHYEARPAWVRPVAMPAEPTVGGSLPVAILLQDQQTNLLPGKVTTYSETAVKILKPEGLAAGNLSIAWNPATDRMSVNKLEIRRDGKVLDVLAGGQTFTIVRRESSLEAAMLDGVLTANIQPEGLQEGDVLVLATTIERADPVLKGHVETIFGAWSAGQTSLAHARVTWPSSLNVQIKRSGDLPASEIATRDGQKIYELTMRNVEPAMPPAAAPLRFSVGRIGEATDFRSWADAARLMLPLYQKASVIPSSGPLRVELDAIKAKAADPKSRAELALQLVQNRVRYVALLMGEGGLVPADAATTWSRRFGDCKAKTALLLGLLRELGIAAEPVLANLQLGDAVGDRLPSIGVFNHILVRAHIGGKSYWLDGTRIGDTKIDDIAVPDFGWVLPVEEGAKLVQLIPPPLAAPNDERRVEIDNSKGLFAPATVKFSETYRGDSAVALNAGVSVLSTDQKREFMRKTVDQYVDGFELGIFAIDFDKNARSLTLSTTGTAKLDWKDGWFYVPTSTIAFSPDWQRPAGPLREAPIAVSHPRFVRDVAIVKLPAGVAAQQKIDPDVNQVLAGVEYKRTTRVQGDTLTVESSERSLVPELPYKEALAAAPRMRALDKDDVYLRAPDNYRPTRGDLAVLKQAEPGSAGERFARGLVMLSGERYDEAIADFTAALEAKPNDPWSFANRGLAYVYKADYAAAARDLDAAAKTDPSNPVMLRGRGLLAERQGKYADAVKHYGDSLERDPTNDFALTRRIAMYRALEQDDKALAETERALKVVPGVADLRVARANIFLERGDRASVAKEAELVAKENPTSNYAQVAAGKIFAAIGRNEEAMKAFDAALAIEREAYVYINRSEVRPATDLAGRKADIDAALRLDPTSEEALVAKATMLEQADKPAEALRTIDSIERNPETRYLDATRARLLVKLGRKSEAEKIFAAAERTATTPRDFNQLCWGKAIAGIMLESALANCREALKRLPDSAGYLDSLGMVLLKLGRLDEALAAYDRANKKNTSAASLMGRAFVHAARGERELARADLDAARELYPNIEPLFASYGLSFAAPPFNRRN